MTWWQHSAPAEQPAEQSVNGGEYFDSNAIPPEELIPYTDSLIFSLVMRDEEICLPLEDESYTIILNTACEPDKVPEELRAFFAYINDPSKRDGSWLTLAIDERVRKYNTTKWRKRQMTLEEMMNQRFDAGREEGIGIGREEGIGIGREEGEEKLNRLYTLLIGQNRIEDLKKAAEDKEYRRKLYQEFGLTD